MRFVIGVAALLFALDVAAQNVNDQIDRFTGARKLDYTNGDGAKLGIPVFSIRAQRTSDLRVGLFQFMVSPVPGRYGRQEMAYLGCRTVDWLADGTPVASEAATHDIKHYNRTLIEFISQPATPEILAKLASASKVEYRLCSKTEGQLTPGDIAALRQISAALSDAQKPSDASPASNQGVAPL